MLVTSDHHYGAVLDADFDFGTFLDELGAQGMNLTRIYPGGMFEVPDKYVAGNPLGPLPGRQILPWARSAAVGAHPALGEPGGPSAKLDLDRWNPDYFARLRAFVERADRRGIVVEVAFFNGMYADSWPLMALYHGNNVQGIGGYEAGECGLFTTMDPRNEPVVRYQTAYVAKIATELNGFDNVIYDLCDEPLLQGQADGSIAILPEAAVTPWLRRAEATRSSRRSARCRRSTCSARRCRTCRPTCPAEAWCDWLPTEYVRAATATRSSRTTPARKPIVERRVGLLRPRARQVGLHGRRRPRSRAGGSCSAAARASST